MAESTGITPEGSDSALRAHANELDLELCEPAKTKDIGLRRRLRVRTPKKQRFSRLKQLLPSPDFSWVTENLNPSHLKPIVRTATSAWICILILIADKTLGVMGQTGFLILAAAFLSPPTGPFIAVFEREMSNLLFVAVSLAWCCLCTFLSNIARMEHSTAASAQEIFSGRYIEDRPTAIFAVFLFVGTTFLLYMKARIAQGPYVLGPTLGCIVVDIALTTGHFYPYASYQVAIGCVLPFVFHSAVALACSVIVFPETVNAQFTKRFRALFLPLSKAMHSQKDIFSISTPADDLRPDLFIKLVGQAEATLGPLAASSRLMKKDLSWGRFGPKDFSRLHELARHMTVRANGMVFYFKIIGSQPGMPSLSLLNTPWSTPMHSQPPSRPPSPTEQLSDVQISSKSSVKSTGRRQAHRHHVASPLAVHSTLRRQHSHHNHHLYHIYHRHNQHHSSRPASLHSTLTTSYENPVGIFEAQRYLNIETRFSHPAADELFPLIMVRLGESVHDLVTCCAETLDHVVGWLEHMNQDRFWKLYGRKRRQWEDAVRDDELAKERLHRVLDEFWKSKRYLVLELYRSADDPNEVGSPSGGVHPPHLFLYQCYLYQYHLMRFSRHLCQFLEEMTELEKTRHHARLWLPILPLRQVLLWSKWEPIDSSLQRNEDEDPDIVQGIDPENQSLLGMPSKRDPDALPPSSKLQVFGNIVYYGFSALGHGNAIFGLKAGVLSILLSLSTFLRYSAEFSYVNRSVWALIYGQLALSRFRGDTAFGWISRVFSTFLGCAVGMGMWYISAGSGNGSHYGLPAVAAVCFPLLFFIRYYFPASPMTLTIFLLTTGLVIGFSWQDTHDPSLATVGKGFEVAWKRFLLVTVGVASAFIFSFLPPTATLRRYLRATYATTTDQLGQLYCDVISFATVPEGPHKEIINKDLIAIRMKLRRSAALKQNIAYEFSLRGRWPEKRYNTINEIQMEIAYLQSHLRSITEHLELSWARAFLKRTQLLEPDFQGDVLGVFSMISFALRTGKSLPQVTPCPLLDRYASRNHGLNVLPKEEAADLGIPHVVTVETLEDEQYIYFSVGVATVFMIITRLDRLMIATKELVGEQYHIHGLPVYNQKPKDVQ